MQKFKETRNLSYIYQNELDKAHFQHDMAYEDFNDLLRRTASDKVLFDKTFNIAKIPKYDGYQRKLASVGYKFVHKKFSNTHKGTGIDFDVVSEDQQLSKELKPIIKKFRKNKKTHLIETIFGVLI